MRMQPKTLIYWAATLTAATLFGSLVLAQAPVDMLRARALEIVDERGTVRARLAPYGDAVAGVRSHVGLFLNDHSGKRLATIVAGDGRASLEGIGMTGGAGTASAPRPAAITIEDFSRQTENLKNELNLLRDRVAALENRPR